MAKNDYWRKRELEHIAQRKLDDAAIAKRLHNKYRDSIDDIQEKIEAFYGRYAGTEGITMKEARKKVSKLDIEKYGKKAKKYVKERNFTKTANEEMRLYNVTMKINRLEMLKKDIQLDLLALSSDEERLLREELTKEIRAEYRRQSGILGMTVNANDKHVAAIVDSSFLSATWSDRIWNNHTALRSELDKLLNRGIIQGLNPRELARGLRKNIETSSYNAERLMRTEMARVQQDVFQDSMKQAEIDQYTYIAEPNACDICAALDGEVFDLKNAAIGENTYPMHPNCRCSTAGYVDREAWEKKVDATTATESQSQYETTKEAFNSVRYTGIDKEMAKEIDDRLLDLANKYPVNPERVTIKALKGNGRWVGMHRYGFSGNNKNQVKFNNELVLSHTFYKNKRSIERTQSLNAKHRGGKNVNPSYLATVDHEYAHVIDTAHVIETENLWDRITKWDGKTIHTRSDVDEISALNRYFTNDNNSFISNKLKKRMMSEYSLKNNKEFFDRVNEELGSYAASSTKEFLAEGFSAYRHIPKDQQTDFLKSFGEGFEELFKEAFGDE